MAELTFSDFIEAAGVACTDGSYVSAKAMRLVEIIRDYDAALDVEWVPREHRLPDDDAIRIVDTRARGLARTVMSFADEGEFTREDGVPVLERLFLADHRRGDPVARLDARNNAVRLLDLKRQLERREERKDLAVHVLRSPLNRYTFRAPDGTLKRIDDGKGTAEPVPGPAVFG